jgi:hypothetical protein
MQGCFVSDAHSMRQAIGMGIVRGAESVAKGSANEEITGDWLNRNEFVGMSLFELSPQLFLVELLGATNQFLDI